MRKKEYYSPAPAYNELWLRHFTVDEALPRLDSCLHDSFVVCPWNKPPGRTHDIIRWLVKHAPFLDGFMVKMDDAFGYKKADGKFKWWFDIEEVDGVLKVPDK